MLTHILVCFLAYVLWKTLPQRTQAAGLGDEPRRIFEELGKISLVDVLLPTRDGLELRGRLVDDDGGPACRRDAQGRRRAG